MKRLLEVVSRIYELYASSEMDRKRKILKLVFPNFWPDGSKLSYDIKKTFEDFLKGAYCLLNWAGVDSNHRTLSRTDLQSVAFSHSATYPYLVFKNLPLTGFEPVASPLPRECATPAPQRLKLCRPPFRRKCRR